MNEEQMQVDSGGSPNMAQLGQEMTPEEAKASLGLATRLGEQMLMMQNPQPMEEPQEEPKPEPTLSEQYPENEDNDKLDQVLEEIQSIKQEIKEVLAEEDGQEN